VRVWGLAWVQGSGFGVKVFGSGVQSFGLRVDLESNDVDFNGKVDFHREYL